MAERSALIDWLVALPVRAAFRLFALLPPAVASDLGGAVARTLGPRLGISKLARRNLARALPALDAAAREQTIRAMWDNLGRVAAEYPHLGRLPVELIGAEHVDAARDDGIGGIFFAAHYGNWELLAPAAGQRGVPLTLVYRAANNPWIETLVQDARAVAPGAGRHVPKGAAAARAAVAALRRQEHLGMLVDQKLNDGIAVPFFGRDAMTAPAPAEFALRFGVPLIPARIERLGGLVFRMTVEPPLAFTPTGDREADVHALMTLVNRRIEEWIRLRPDHWFWLHKRWPD